MTSSSAAWPATDALTRLVGDPDDFLARHFGREPLLRREVAGPWPLTLDDVDALLTAGGLRWPAFRLVERGRTVPRAACTRSGTIGGQRVDDLADVGRVLARVDDGATLVLQGLHRYHPPVADLCRELETALSHPVQANAYLTPPGSRGLDVHHDTHDVLAWQAHGRKHWVVHEPAVEVPLPQHGWSSERHTPGPLMLDTELRPGDLLYLPRGAPHAAETVGGFSLHLTIGVRVVTYHDLVQRAARDLGDDVELREALPPGWDRDPAVLRQELGRRLKSAATRLAEADADRLLSEAATSRRRAVRPDLRGALRELADLDDLDDRTELTRREGLAVALERRDERAVVVLPDREVAFPGGAADVLALLLDGATHRLGDLADRVDGTGRQVLARRLVREGVLVTGRDTQGG